MCNVKLWQEAGKGDVLGNACKRLHLTGLVLFCVCVHSICCDSSRAGIPSNGPPGRVFLVIADVESEPVLLSIVDQNAQSRFVDHLRTPAAGKEKS